MKPGHGEIVLAEGDVEIPAEEQELIEAFRRELDAGMWAAVPTEGLAGRRRGRARQELRRSSPGCGARDLLSARRRRCGPCRPLAAWRSPLGTAAVVLLVLFLELARPRLRRRVAARPRRDSPRTQGARRRELRPRPRTSRRAARPRAAALVRERGGLGDVQRPRVPARARPRGRGCGRGSGAVRVPDLPPQADRRLRARHRRAAERVLRHVPRPHTPVRQLAGCPTPTTCWRSGWRSPPTSGA